MTPTVVDAACKGNIHEWTPFRPFGLLQELHLCLMRKSIPLAGIARYAGTHDIFPCSLASAITGKHVIDVQIIPLKEMAAVLARVFVALKDIETCELHLFLWQSVEKAEDNDAGNPDL